MNSPRRRGWAWTDLPFFTLAIILVIPLIYHLMLILWDWIEATASGL